MGVTHREVEEDRRHLMAWIAWHMKANGIATQVELAERFNVSKGTVTLWMKGTKHLPNFEALLSISKELRVPLDILLGRDPPTTT